MFSTFAGVGGHLSFQQMGQSVDGDVGLAQIMGQRVGEGLEFLVGLAQFGGALFHPGFKLGVELQDLLLGELALGNVTQDHADLRIAVAADVLRR